AFVGCHRSHHPGLETGRHHPLSAHGEEVLMSTAVIESEQPGAAEEPPIQSFLVTFIIRRFDPEVDEEPRWVDYDVEMYPTERVLDALHKIKWDQDGSLTF